MQFKDHLIGERISLRRTLPIKKTAESLFSLIDNSRKFLEPWLMWVSKTNSVSDTESYLAQKEEEYKQGSKIEYGIYLGDILIGSIALVDISETNKSAEIGYWISKDFTSKGYTSEALKIIEEFAFEDLNLNRIQIKCDELNKPSCRVAQKCGYKYEGKLREDTYNSYDHTLRNTLVYSKLKSDRATQKS